MKNLKKFFLVSTLLTSISTSFIFPMEQDSQNSFSPEGQDPIILIYDNEAEISFMTEEEQEAFNQTLEEENNPAIIEAFNSLMSDIENSLQQENANKQGGG